MLRDKTDELARILRQSIREGDYRAGRLMPSERDLANEFSLSRTTVRRAIEQLAREGLVLRRPGAGTFVANDAEGPAPSSSARLEPTVAFVIPTFSNPLYGEMIDGIEQEARRFGMRVLAGQSNYQMKLETMHLERHAADPAVGGMIMVPAGVGAPLRAAIDFVAHGKALVYLSRWPEGIEADRIGSNHRLTAMVGVSHLIDLGHHRVAYIEGLPRLPGFSPQEGYEAAFDYHSLARDPALTQVLEVRSETAGLEGVRALRKAGTEFTAVLARNDVTALGILRGLKEAGLRIPSDVSVVSINNSQLAEHTDPPLTSADPFAVELGRQAFHLVRDRVQKGYAGPVRRITLDPRLVIRASTAAVAKDQRRRLGSGSRS